METFIEKITRTEHAYTCLFSSVVRTEYGYRYTDMLLPDMYCHNSFRVSPDAGCIPLSLFAEEAAYRRGNGQDVVQIEYFDGGDAAFPEGLDYESVSQQPVYYAALNEFTPSSSASCTVKPARDERMFTDGRNIDIASFIPGFEEFAGRRYDRKKPVYADRSAPFENLICYAGDTPVGNCDLFIDGDTAKIEDLDVLEHYQHRGYGTAILQEIGGICRDHGVRHIYLLVDDDNEGAIRLYTAIGMREVMKNHLYRREIDA